MRQPLALYLADGASSGSGPSHLRDRMPQAFDLPITYGASGAAWTEVPGGRALSSASGCTANSTTASTKIETALSGSKTLTMMWVVNLKTNYNNSNYGGFILANNSGEISGLELQSNRLEWWSQFNGFSNYVTSVSFVPAAPGLQVFFAVMNTADTTAAQRSIIYESGLVVATGTTTVTQDSTISFPSGGYLQVGADPGSPTTYTLVNTDILACGIWKEALTPQEVSVISRRIKARNDIPPWSHFASKRMRAAA